MAHFTPKIYKARWPWA